MSDSLVDKDAFIEELAKSFHAEQIANAHLRAEVDRLTRERDAAFADRDAEERERILLSKEVYEMTKRQPYDAATPFYPEKVTENDILSRLRGLGFGSMEREVSTLINDRNLALARVESAERKLAMAVEALKPFAGLRAARLMTDGCKYDFRLDVAWIRKASATLAALEKNDE